MNNILCARTCCMHNQNDKCLKDEICIDSEGQCIFYALRSISDGLPIYSARLRARASICEPEPYEKPMEELT